MLLKQAIDISRKLLQQYVSMTVSDIEFMVASHYTSKINDFEDLAKVSTYGFRGEALHSLCSVCGIFILIFEFSR